MPGRSVLQWLAGLVAALFTAAYFFTALPRIFYPYDLDFIEDSLLIQSMRFAEDKLVYIAPSAEFVPHVYMPLYSWLGGMLFRAFGVGYEPLRWLSFYAIMATAGLLFLVALRECQSMDKDLEPWPVLCAALYLGGYRLTGFWYELARVDSLFVMLSMLGLMLGFYASKSPLGMIVSAVVLTLAFFTKQTALAFGACVAVYLLFTVGRRAWLFVGTLAGLIGVGLVWLNAATGGWFVYHTFLIASADRIEIGRVFRYIGFELFGSMAGLSLMAVAALVIGWRRSGVGFLRSERWVWAIGAAAVMSGVGRVSVGGNVNNLMPAYALLCLSPALLWKTVRFGGDEGDKGDRGIKWRTVLLAGVLIQFALGVYNPLRYIPTRAMRGSGDRLIAQIREIDGPVLVMMHPYYAWLAGKEPSAQIAELWYLRVWSNVPLPDDFVARIEGRYYTAIISSESMFETDAEIRGLIEQYYARAGTIDGPPTLTGMVVQPSLLYVPR
jgi:hypothetical protein